MNEANKIELPFQFKYILFVTKVYKISKLKAEKKNKKNKNRGGACSSLEDDIPTNVKEVYANTEEEIFAEVCINLGSRFMRFNGIISFHCLL